MRKTASLLLILILLLPSAHAGINSNKARYVGGTGTPAPVRATGFLGDFDETNLVFDYGKGKSPDKASFPAGRFSLPYASVTSLRYGQHANLRIGETIALAALAGVGGLLLLLSKSKTHYLTIQFKDAQGRDGLAEFEVGKDVIRPLLSSLEVRTGKKIEYDASNSGKGPVKP